MSGDSAATHFATHLNESDALLWSIERDPHLRTTIVAISLLDESPDWDRYRARMEDACRVVPRLRQKVTETPLRIGPPCWQFDDDFDIDFHLRRMVVPAPGDLQTLRVTMPINLRSAADGPGNNKFAPPSGAAFSIALLSHHDQCCIGVNMDAAAVPDPEELMRCLREGFDEVLEVGAQAGTRA